MSSVGWPASPTISGFSIHSIPPTLPQQRRHAEVLCQLLLPVCDIAEFSMAFAVFDGLGRSVRQSSIGWWIEDATFPKNQHLLPVHDA